MTLSIITTFHNSETYIKECLSSVYAIPDNIEYEHLLVNDGSSDNTESIIQSFQSDKHKLIGRKKIGRGQALNFGIQRASGDFICILDSDDMLNKAKNQKNIGIEMTIQSSLERTW